MALRMMLVSLVACMGLEIPNQGDFTSWAQSGREWIASGLADPEPTIEVTRPPAVAARTRADDDRNFEAISEEMAASFAAELVASRAEETGPADAPAMTRAPEPTSVGLPEGEEIASLTAPADEAIAVASDDEPTDTLSGADEAIAVASDDEPADTLSGADEAPSRDDRLSSAVRLTREAARAWGAVMQDAPEDAVPAY